MKRSKISQERSKSSLQSEFCIAKSEFVSLKTKGKMKLQRNLSGTKEQSVNLSPFKAKFSLLKAKLTP